MTHYAHGYESTLERAWEFKNWVLRLFFFNDCVRGTRSSCQTSKCEEDDGYVRKPRQRKRTVRSGFPSLHWLILPLRVRASEKGVCLNGFSSSSISDKLLSAGASRDLPRFGGNCCAMLSFEKWTRWLKEARLLRNTGLIFNKLDAAKDVWRCIWGIQHCHLCISRNSSYPQAVSTREAQETCALVVLPFKF